MAALEIDRICHAFTELHPRRMTEPSLFGAVNIVEDRSGYGCIHMTACIFFRNVHILMQYPAPVMNNIPQIIEMMYHNKYHLPVMSISPCRSFPYSSQSYNGRPPQWHQIVEHLYEVCFWNIDNDHSKVGRSGKHMYPVLQW